MIMDTQDIEKYLKKSTLISNTVSLIIALVVAMGTCYGFYYNTQTSLGNHSIAIREIKDEVTDLKTDINSTNIFKGMTQVEQKSLQERVTRIEDKMDKMLEILSGINSNGVRLNKDL